MATATLEQETTFRWHRGDEFVVIWSDDKTVQRKIEKAVKPDIITLFQDGSESGRWYKVPMRSFGFRVKRSSRAPMSPEHRAAARDRLAKSRAKKHAK